MGLGAWLAEQWPKIYHNPLRSLQVIELLIPILMIISLPILSLTIYFARQYTTSIDLCQSLVCSSVGLLVIIEAFLLLLAVGTLVGMEIPLFSKLGNSKLGKILAGDYLGAFLAGVIFSTLLLPLLGVFGVLVFAATLHLVVAFLIRSKSKLFNLVWSILACFIIFMTLNYQKIEGSLFYLMTKPSRSFKSEVLNYKYTGKQFFLFTQDTYSNGLKDQRLFLDGFLQWSTLGGVRSYHKGLTEIRRKLGDTAKKILILGGGDGLAANTLLDNYPSDFIQIVDFDCELLNLFASDQTLRGLAPKAWDSKGVKITCADAFWYIQKEDQYQQWDLVLVDFPHGVGDAASAKVETYDFFLSIWKILKTGGYISTHHEDYDTESQRCIKKNLALAGFETTGEKQQGMGFLYGKKINWDNSKFAYNTKYVQSELRLPCWTMFEN